MATVWLVKEVKDGGESTSGNGIPVSLAECVQHLGLQKGNYYSALDARPRFENSNAKVTGPRYVVIELDETEAAANAWKPGFYLLTISVKDAVKILKSIGINISDGDEA